MVAHRRVGRAVPVISQADRPQDAMAARLEAPGAVEDADQAFGFLGIRGRPDGRPDGRGRCRKRNSAKLI